MPCITGACRKLTLEDGRSLTLVELLGTGSSASVYRAVLESSWRVRRPVAVKVLNLHRRTDVDEAMRQLARIARRAACVRHSSVVQVYDVDRAEGVGGEPFAPCVIAELVDGESLATLVTACTADAVRVPVDFAIVVALRAAEALAAALFSECPNGSLTGLVHGALSPRQILVSTEGEVKVGDFGLSSLREGRELGRLTYTAPEIATGGAPTPEADVFSLGAILRELLVGPRFAANTGAQDAYDMVGRGAFHSSFLAPNLPPTLREVLERSTAPNPIRRYGHARAMALDLRRAMHRLNLCDAQTCIRHAIVGWFGDGTADAPHRAPMKSTVVANDVAIEDDGPSSGDTLPSLPRRRARG